MRIFLTKIIFIARSEYIFKREIALGDNFYYVWEKRDREREKEKKQGERKL